MKKLVETIEGKVSALDLRADIKCEREYLTEVTVYATALAMNYIARGKFILPWFGGSPAVWTTCMLVFQVLLFAGYAYAHVVSSNLPPTRQAIVHGCLLVLALFAVLAYAGLRIASM